MNLRLGLSMAGFETIFKPTEDQIPQSLIECFRQRPSNDALAPISPRKGPSLHTLPGEIQRQILFWSCEPNLIHTCRSLHQSLPEYNTYIKSLAILAFKPRRNRWKWTAIPPINLPVIGLERFVDVDQLQVDICPMKWLTPAILAATHVTLLEHLVYATVLSPEAPMYSDQRELFERRLRTLKNNYRWANSTLPTITTPSCPGSPFDDVKIRIDGMWGMVRKKDPADAQDDVDTDDDEVMPDHRDYCFCIFETEMVPDCLLANPTEETSIELLELLQDFGDKLYEGWTRYHLSCSTYRMQHAIMTTLRGTPELSRDETSTEELVERGRAFRILTELNAVCDEPAPMRAEMLRVAIDTNQPDKLDLLLDMFPTGVYRRIHWDCDFDELLRLELDLRRHQHRCYKVIVKAIKRRYPGGIGQEMAQRAGFCDVQALNRARSDIYAMFVLEDGSVAAELREYFD